MKKITVLLACLVSLACFAQKDTIYIDPDSAEIEERTDFMNIYYSYDFESRVVYTTDGVFDAHQYNWENGLTRSWTFGIGWTHIFFKNFSGTVGMEYSDKAVQTDSIPPNRTSPYVKGVTYINMPLSVQYAFGNKLRLGGYAGCAPKLKIDGGEIFRNKNRVNADIRCGIFAEYKWPNLRIRVMPVYRLDIFDTYKWFNRKNAATKGVQLEIIF